MNRLNWPGCGFTRANVMCGGGGVSADRRQLAASAIINGRIEVFYCGTCRCASLEQVRSCISPDDPDASCECIPEDAREYSGSHCYVNRWVVCLQVR